MKQKMDWWFTSHPEEEREFQQLMVRENNFGGAAKGTDYFICDIEYANENGRIDLIAVHWPSSSTYRKENKKVGFVAIPDWSAIQCKYTRGTYDFVEEWGSIKGLTNQVATVQAAAANNLTQLFDDTSDANPDDNHKAVQNAIRIIFEKNVPRHQKIKKLMARISG